MKTENSTNRVLSAEAENEQSRLAPVTGCAVIKKFRRGKKFKEAYFDIGKTNQSISNLLIEAESFERHQNFVEAQNRRAQAENMKQDLRAKYESDNFDLDYYLPQVSGIYVKQSSRDVL